MPNAPARAPMPIRTFQPLSSLTGRGSRPGDVVDDQPDDANQAERDEAGGTQCLLPGAATARLAPCAPRPCLGGGLLLLSAACCGPWIRARGQPYRLGSTSLESRWCTDEGPGAPCGGTAPGDRGGTGRQLPGLPVRRVHARSRRHRRGGGDLRPNRSTDLAGLIQSESRRNRNSPSPCPRCALRSTGWPGTTRAAGPPAREPRPRRRPDPGEGPSGDGRTRGRAAGLSLPGSAGTPGRPPAGHPGGRQRPVGGGAEAMTIQGQRVTSRTGVKCVGNSVVLHGVPYAPPYVIARSVTRTSWKGIAGATPPPCRSTAST